MIPNAEIREIFETTILKWFQESALTWNRETLFHAVWNQDAKTISIEMTKLLRKQSVTMITKKIIIMLF